MVVRRTFWIQIECFNLYGRYHIFLYGDGICFLAFTRSHRLSDMSDSSNMHSFHLGTTFEVAPCMVFSAKTSFMVLSSSSLFRLYLGLSILFSTNFCNSKPRSPSFVLALASFPQYIFDCNSTYSTSYSLPLSRRKFVLHRLHNLLLHRYTKTISIYLF